MCLTGPCSDMHPGLPSHKSHLLVVLLFVHEQRAFLTSQVVCTSDLTQQGIASLAFREPLVAELCLRDSVLFTNCFLYGRF